MDKRKLKKYICHFGDDDIVIGDIRLNPVHILPKGQWETGREADFYMYDNSDIYLLRIISGDKCTVTLSDCEDIRYIIICIPVDNIFETLEKIIPELKKLPYGKKISGTESLLTNKFEIKQTKEEL